MKAYIERAAGLKCPCRSESDNQGSSAPLCSEQGQPDDKSVKTSSWSTFLASAFSNSEKHSDSSNCGRKAVNIKHELRAAVRRVVSASSMWRIQECVLGFGKSSISCSTSDIWLLGVCYRLSQDGTSGDSTASNEFSAFEQDFSSRILMTYRKGFEAIGDSKYTSDVGWGCMLRSSQMLIAQALLFHHLGRLWRKPLQKPFDQKYIEILHLFGDSESCAFSIHNLLQAGKDVDLEAGKWAGPYQVCRSWETLVCILRNTSKDCSLPMALYIVSGDEDGHSGGAPVVCVEDASRHCHDFSHGHFDWTPILLLVPLVLGLDKVNPRYIPLLRATFTFPQSLGILGGKPGASTYITGVQDEKAIYLDPHDVQQVVNVSNDDVETNTSSYHTNSIRHIPLDSIDPSLAIGFYCRDKDDFDDFCRRASQLAAESNGAPLFTVSQSHKRSQSVSPNAVLIDGGEAGVDDSCVDLVCEGEGSEHDNDWQLL